MADENKDIKYRVWHMPQLGKDIPTFYVDVETLKEARMVLNTLATYDSFQYDNRIKPDYSSAQGLEQKPKGECWEDFNIEVDGNYYDDVEEYFEMEVD